MKDDPKAHNRSTDIERKLLEANDLKGSVSIVCRRLEAADRGEAGIPADQVLSKVRKALEMK